MRDLSAGLSLTKPMPPNNSYEIEIKRALISGRLLLAPFEAQRGLAEIEKYLEGPGLPSKDGFV